MSPLSILHRLAALPAVLVGLAILCLRKGDALHHRLVWIHVSAMTLGLVGILVRTLAHSRSFVVYALLILGVLAVTILVSRRRSRIEARRPWHASPVSYATFGSAMAAGSIFGGLAIGASNGPAFYRLFNIVIASFTVAGQWLSDTRPVTSGRMIGPRELGARLRFNALVLGGSMLLFVAQLPLTPPPQRAVPAGKRSATV